MTHNYQNFKAWAVGLMKIELSTHIYIFTHPSLFLLVHYKKNIKRYTISPKQVYKYNLFLYTQQNKKKNAF